MTFGDESVRKIADGYTAAWNSASADAVAMFYAEDGGIVINRGSPWEGRAGVAQMAAGFFADVPDLTLVCDGIRVAGDHVAYLWTSLGRTREADARCAYPAGKSGTSTPTARSGPRGAGSTPTTMPGRLREPESSDWFSVADRVTSADADRTTR